MCLRPRRRAGGGGRGSDIQASSFCARQQQRRCDRVIGHILAAANGVIARDPARFGETLRATRPIIEVVGFSDRPAKPAGLIARSGGAGQGGTDRHDIAVFYRPVGMPRPYEETPMRAHVPDVIVGRRVRPRHPPTGEVRWRAAAPAYAERHEGEADRPAPAVKIGDQLTAPGLASRWDARPG